MGRRLALIFACALAACSSASSASSSSEEAGTFTSEPLTTVTSTGGALRIDVRTSPSQPPTRGMQDVQLVVVDAATGEPRPGLSLAVKPWMPAMGHGTAVTPTVTETSPGTYVVHDVYLFMPGTWQLRTTISGSVQDHLEPSFDIP